MTIPWTSLFSAPGAGSALLVERRPGLVREISEQARTAQMFPLHVPLGWTDDFDLAYLLLAKECLIDLGFNSPQPINNVDFYIEELIDAQLPGERGQVLVLEDIDGLGREPSPSLDVFMWVLWALFDARRRVAAATGELKAIHWTLIGAPCALGVVERALRAHNREISESPFDWVREMHEPIPVVWVEERVEGGSRSDPRR